MAVERRERPASFPYEPADRPTIPPGMTVADYRRRRAGQRGRQARRRRHGP